MRSVRYDTDQRWDTSPIYNEPLPALLDQAGIGS